MPLRALLPAALLLASCAAPVAVSSSPPSGTVPPATAAATTSAPSATAAQNPAVSCGLLVAFAGGGGDPKYLLTLMSGNTTTQYRLSGPGTAPSDIGDLFATKTPQTLAISGRQVTANSAEPQAVNLMDFTVTRVASCSLSTTPEGFVLPQGCSYVSGPTRSSSTTEWRFTCGGASDSAQRVAAALDQQGWTRCLPSPGIAVWWKGSISTRVTPSANANDNPTLSQYERDTTSCT